MSERLVIQAEDVRKRYRLGVIGRDLLVEEAGALLGRLRGRADVRKQLDPAGTEQKVGDYFWSLRGVSFSMREGEILGIVGRNGAGKSTLLKLLSRISLPTHGTIRMRGKVSSLLEVGTGFHPELTGRENVFLNGAILGMRKAEIERKLDMIVAFSGVEHHLDTPIKRYSSGMKVRLGFAVAAHMDPEILIVDEVLAVGDAEFQRKCLGSMREVAGSGRTILFVSHNMVSVQSLCTRALWLDKGLVRQDGPVEHVVKDYLGTYSAQLEQQTWAASEAPGTDEVRLRSVRVASEQADGEFTIGAGMRVELELENLSVLDEELNVRLQFRAGNDSIVFVTGLSESAGAAAWNVGMNKVTCFVPADLLNTGTYRIQVLIMRRGSVAFKVENAVVFEMREGARKGASFNQWPGVVRPHLRWVR